MVPNDRGDKMPWKKTRAPAGGWGTAGGEGRAAGCSSVGVMTVGMLHVLTWKQRREGVSHVDIWGKSVPGTASAEVLRQKRVWLV